MSRYPAGMGLEEDARRQLAEDVGHPAMRNLASDRLRVASELAAEFAEVCHRNSFPMISMKTIHEARGVFGGKRRATKVENGWAVQIRDPDEYYFVAVSSNGTILGQLLRQMDRGSTEYTWTVSSARLRDFPADTWKRSFIAEVASLLSQT